MKLRFDRYSELKRAQELDPLTPKYTAWVGWYYGMIFGQYAKAIEEIQKSLELLPDYNIGLRTLGHVYCKMGKYEEAIKAHKKLAELTGRRNEIARTYALAGRRDEARKIAEMEARAVPRVISARRLARIYAALGEKDEAFRWLEVSYEERQSTFPWLYLGFDSLHDDPRFKELLRKLNLLELE